MKNLVDNSMIDNLIRIGLLLLLITISLLILAPFVIMLIWGIIIAVALFPVFKKSVKALGNKRGLTAILFTLVGLAFLVVPSVFLTESTVTGYKNLKVVFDQGHMIPNPTDEVKEWPVIGEKLYEIWNLAAHNLREFIVKYEDQVSKIGGKVLGVVASLGLTILQFMVSVIIAGILLAKAELGTDTTHKFAKRLVGDKGDEFVNLTAGTIRSVVQGVLGIALIQAIATAVLLLIFSIPFPGLWALIVLVLAIMQLPPFLVLGPIMIYIFSYQEPTPAVIFTIFAILISISDSLLKPVFLGRGLDIPMLVVLLGAIGGMVVFGILGLFVGAVVLALSYKLMMAWLKAES